MAALKRLKMFKKNSELCFNNLNLSIKDNFSRHVPSVFSGKLFDNVLKGAYLFGEQNTCYFDRVPQGQLPKQTFTESCSRKKLFRCLDEVLS